MSEDDKDNINIDNKEEETKSDENQPQGESSPSDTQPIEPSGEDQKETQPKVDEKKEMVRLKNLKVDNIITDYPDRWITFLNK